MTRTALIAIDGSDFAKRAAQRAVDLLGECSYTVLRVMTHRAPIAPLGTENVPLAWQADVLEQTEQAEEQQAARDVEVVVEEIGRAASGRVERGDPRAVICDIANSGGYDVVVVGSHGAGILKRLVLGSVSDYVVHHAAVPVLVMRERH